MPIILFRPARDTDLAQIYDMFYENEVGDLPTPPPPGGVPSGLRHTLATGTMHVVEQDSRVLAFAAAITRGAVAVLTDLFVRPAHQSAQFGGMLLWRVLPQDERIHGTFSSTDPRALALYIRAGMRPKWPHFNLRLDRPLRTGSSLSVPATGSVSLVWLCDECSRCQGFSTVSTPTVRRPCGLSSWKSATAGRAAVLPSSRIWR